MIETKRYRIVKCPRCSAFQIADARNKSKSCSQCARRFEIADLQVLALAKDAREARTLVATFKMPKETGTGPNMI